MGLDSGLIERVYHQQSPVVEDVNRSAAFTVLPALATAIKSEAQRIMQKYSPDEADPFSQDALQSLILSQLASFLTYGDLDQTEIVQPHMLGGAYAEFYFEVKPEPKS